MKSNSENKLLPQLSHDGKPGTRYMSSSRMISICCSAPGHSTQAHLRTGRGFAVLDCGVVTQRNSSSAFFS